MCSDCLVYPWQAVAGTVVAVAVVVVVVSDSVVVVVEASFVVVGQAVVVEQGAVAPEVVVEVVVGEAVHLCMPALGY